MQLPKLFRNEARASVAIAVPLRGSTQAPRGYEARARVSAVVGKWSLCGLKTPGRFLPTLVGVVGEGGGISRQSGSIRATLVLAIPVPSVGQAQGVGSTRGMSSCARHFLSYPVVCSVVFCSRVKSAGSSRPTPAGAGRRRNCSIITRENRRPAIHQHPDLKKRFQFLRPNETRIIVPHCTACRDNGRNGTASNASI